MKSLAFLFLFAIVAVSLAVAVQPARALQNEYPYAVTCIHNSTDMPIYYSYRWGRSGAWHATEVDPGAGRWHSYKYDLGSRVSPNLYVKFDTNLGNRGNVREYILQRFATTEQVCSLGKSYDFVRIGNGIDLEAER